jgi:predicted RNA binding protein YcfA (HicA-like mRNA interferase family)
MKFNDFYAELTAKGCYVLRHGGSHDIWINPKTGGRYALGRHGSQEVPSGTERAARRRLGI